MDEKIILESLKKIENECMMDKNTFPNETVDTTIFYQKVKGLMTLLETSLDSGKTGGGFFNG
jgi:hypothetical protein